MSEKKVSLLFMLIRQFLDVQKFYESEVNRGVKNVDFTVTSVGTEGTNIIKTGGDVKVVKNKGSETGKYTVSLAKVGGQYLLKDVVDTRTTDA